MFHNTTQIIGKDSNINVVSFAAKCVGALADGLRKKFCPFTPMVYCILCNILYICFILLIY